MVGVTTWVPPVISRAPVHDVSSTLLAVQLVALPLAQVSVLDPPSAIVVRSALKLAPGAAPTVTVTSWKSEAPPAPSQVSR